CGGPVRRDRTPFFSRAAAAEGDDPVEAPACDPTGTTRSFALANRTESFEDTCADVVVCVVVVAPLGWAALRVKNQRRRRKSQCWAFPPKPRNILLRCRPLAVGRLK